MSEGTRTGPWKIERGPGDAATLWFNSTQHSQNVLDAEAIEGLDRSLDEIEADSSLRGLLVRSSKEGGFCAGADLRAFRTCATPEELAGFLRRGLEVFDRLAGLKIPTAAVLHGNCLGGGLELALACRRRIALASNVPLQLGSPEVHLGLIPAWGALVRLPRLLSPRDAMLLVLGGNPIGFLQAKSQGLVDRLVSSDEPDRIAEAISAAEPAGESPLDADAWRPELEFAAAKVEEQPPDHPEAPQQILELIKLDIAEGPAAARARAIEVSSELAFHPAARDAIDDFFGRRTRARQAGEAVPVMPTGGLSSLSDSPPQSRPSPG
ncbi:Fatty acid oxidation complex subunit alpha [Aquisphaera giovannonii]|uniref:Fatty acid oxidation complex subunit alpha n=1 Tax=Aquisphaera giovannonii TaxID=406548 RepID=A0A5B9W9F7_9BACT|nr:enoyl-CoA hydratase-related protein [Aquisphaera giovannonii]QEH36460.1 Fatty acid oxidation complex subunit alpha [Aquisphaera giovannonii]